MNDEQNSYSKIEEAKSLVLNQEENLPKLKFATYSRAASFLRAQKFFYQNLNRLPDFGLGPEGSIDICFRSNENDHIVELLVNVPEEGYISFYGKNNLIEIKGKFLDEFSSYEFLFSIFK